MLGIVIAAESPEWSADVAQAVRAAGYEVSVCVHPADLRGQLEATSPAVLVLWGDFGGTEPELDATLRAQLPLRLVVSGGTQSAAQLVEWRRCGHVERLPALFDMEELEAALARFAWRVEERGDTAHDEQMRRVLAAADAAACTDATVLVVGESGSGTTTLARRIHGRSARAVAPLVELDCAGLAPEEGVRRLAHSWQQATEGLAGTGTLVLEHLDELEPSLAPALLATWARAAETGRQARVLATAHRPLRAELAAGVLPAELVYRFDVIALEVPPLRERPADILPLAEQMLRAAARRVGVDPPRLGAEARASLSAHRYAGNLSELAGLMERAVLLFSGGEVDVVRLLGGRSASEPNFVATTFNLRELEEAAIRRSLEAARGNRSKASEALGISTRTLRNKIRSYGLAAVGRPALAPGLSD